MKRTLLFAFSLFMTATTFAQLPAGTIVYALPKTSVKLYVEATHEVFTAGPYAKFASKYLGFEVPVDNKESYALKTVDLRWFVEADAAQTNTVSLKDSKGTTNFLAMTATGLVSMFEQNTTAAAVPWRFANGARTQEFNNRGHESHLAKENTTFYKTVKTDKGYERVPVQQSQVVEKNIERRAEETANAIYSLRKKRMDLLTGDADNVPAGDALRAALEEINRLEQEYLSLFVGKSSVDVQSATFEVVPDPKQAKQLYIVFRLSDTEGLLAPDNMAGRPIVIELVAGKKTMMPIVEEKGKFMRYCIPEVVQARLLDGQRLLLQTRIPVYQLGQVMTYPL